MFSNRSKPSDLILNCGRPLDDVGVHNWALTRQQALAAINQLEAAGIAVLGGDVYEMSDGLPQLSYDNWYCDRKPGESDSIFLFRSTAVARDYIVNHRFQREEDRLFAIVTECKEKKLE